MIEVSLAGLMIGAVVGEYLLQPELLSATKIQGTGFSKFQAGALHTLIWSGAVVLFGSLGVGAPPYAMPGWEFWLMSGGLAVVHYAIDCTPLMDWLRGLFGSPALNRSLEQLRAIEMEMDDNDKKPKRGPDPGFISATLTYGIAGDLRFELAMHMLVVFAWWFAAQFL